MQLSYRAARAGGWTLIARGSGFVVLEPAAGAFVDAVRDALAGDAPVEAVVSALTRDGFARTPSFALVEPAGDDVRVIVRGGLDIEIADASGSHTVSGSGISTWTERGFTAVTSATLTVSGATAADEVPALTMETGDAFVASVSLAARPGVGEPDAGGAVDLADPDPEPEPAIAADPDSTSVSEATVASVPDETPATSDASAPLDEGDTVLRPRRSGGGSAAVDAVGEAPAASGGTDSTLGDHDGNTVLSSDLPKGRGAKPAAAADSTPADATPAVQVPVVPMPRLELSGGASELLDRPILVGRAPSVSKVSGGQMPRLVTIGTADHDISRNHAQFTLEGGTVVVTDLHSRNGTLVVLPGKGPQKLRAGEPTAVIIGTVVDFGGGVTMTVRDS